MAQIIDPSTLAATDLDSYLTAQGFVAATALGSATPKAVSRPLTLSEQSTVATALKASANLKAGPALPSPIPPPTGYAVRYTRGMRRVQVTFGQDPTTTALADNSIISTTGAILIELLSAEILVL